VGLIEMIASEFRAVIFGVNSSAREYPRATGEIDFGIASGKKNFDSTCAVGGITNKNSSGGSDGNLFNLGLCPFLWSIAFCFVH
jgi:hypothetical protein